MKRLSTILATVAATALLAMSLNAVAGPPETSARGVTPAKRTTRFVAPPGALASANDTCATAIVVPASGPFPWTDTQDTTGNGTDALPSCSTNGGADEWYSFTPATSGLYNLSTCTSTVDTILALYTGSCGALTEVACIDDACGLESMLVENLTAGTTYFIQILGYNGEAGSIPFVVAQSPDPATVVTSFPADPAEGLVWGCGYTDAIVNPTFAPGPGGVWTAEYNTLTIRQWTTGGLALGPFYSGYWADMDYDAGRDLMYQMDLPGGGTRQDNCIHTWSPTNGAPGATICDPANIWSAVANQAVAHDPVTDTLYVAGWVNNTIYHVAGLGSTSPTPGTTLGSWPVSNISGLAWLCDGTLAAAISEPSDRILILDPANGMAVLRSYTLPNPSSYASAAMDAQPDGQVWLINQNDGYAYLVDVGANCAACEVTCTASATPTSGAAPLAVTFTSTATPTGCAGTPTFAWAFGDGGTSTDQNPTYTYTAAGTYTWTLTVTVDGVTCTQTGTVTACEVTCTASATPASGTAPLAVTFTSTATPTGCLGTPTFAWVFGDGGTSTDQNPIYTYTAAGTYTWTLTVTVDGVTCTQTGTVTVTAPAYDVYIFDDYGRSSLCLNSATGEFQYNILIGYGAGNSFTGMVTSTFYNGVLNFRTPAGLPYSLVGSYLQVYHKGKASFTHRPLRINSVVYDNNTLNNPPGCGATQGTR